MTKATGWRAQIEALPESAFPLKSSLGKLLFTDRADMMAGFEWYAEEGVGTYRERMDTSPVDRTSNAVAWQWKARKDDLAKAAKARAKKLEPLKAAREKRAAEKVQARLDAREATMQRLRDDTATLSGQIIEALQPAFQDIDWDALRDPVGRLSSLVTRLRFQVEAARRRTERKELGV